MHIKILFKKLISQPKSCKRQKRSGNGTEGPSSNQERYIPRNRRSLVWYYSIPPNRPTERVMYVPRLVVRVRVSASSLYRGNQIARHKFRLCAVMRVKATTVKLAESKRRGAAREHVCICAPVCPSVVQSVLRSAFFCFLHIPAHRVHRETSNRELRRQLKRTIRIVGRRAPDVSAVKLRALSTRKSLHIENVCGGLR